MYETFYTTLFFSLKLNLYVNMASFFNLYYPSNFVSASDLVGSEFHTDHYHRSSNLAVGISEGYFIFDFALLSSEVARPIQPTMCTKVAIKHRSLSAHFVDDVSILCKPL